MFQGQSTPLSFFRVAESDCSRVRLLYCGERSGYSFMKFLDLATSVGTKNLETLSSSLVPSVYVFFLFDSILLRIVMCSTKFSPFRILKLLHTSLKGYIDSLNRTGPEHGFRPRSAKVSSGWKVFCVALQCLPSKMTLGKEAHEKMRKPLSAALRSGILPLLLKH